MLGLLFYLLFQHNDPSIYGKTIFSAIYKLTLMKSQSDNFIWRCSPWFPRVQCNSVTVWQWSSTAAGHSSPRVRAEFSASSRGLLLNLRPGRVLVVAISEMRGSHPSINTHTSPEHSHIMVWYHPHIMVWYHSHLPHPDITLTSWYHSYIMISLPHHDITITHVGASPRLLAPSGGNKCHAGVTRAWQRLQPTGQI